MDNNEVWTINNLCEFFTIIIEKGNTEYLDKLEAYREFSGDIETFSEYFKELFEPFLDSVEVLRFIKNTKHLPDKFFVRKFDKFCRGICLIPLKEREKFVNLLSKHETNKDGVLMLDIINKIEEETKIDFLIKLFEARVNGIIDDKMWKRLIVMVNRTMYDDILYLQTQTLDTDFQPDSLNNEILGLMTNGLVIYIGADLSTMKNRYYYPEYTRILASIIFS